MKIAAGAGVRLGASVGVGVRSWAGREVTDGEGLDAGAGVLGREAGIGGPARISSPSLLTALQASVDAIARRNIGMTSQIRKPESLNSGGVEALRSEGLWEPEAFNAGRSPSGF